MKFGVIADPVFLRHENPPGHPEHPARIEALLTALEGFGDRIERHPPVDVETSALTRVHRPDFVERIRRTSERPSVALDPDTYTSPESYKTARLAAGSAVRLIDLVNRGDIEAGMLLARPPGHHAESGRAMGFCLFNHVAVAAQWALDRGPAERVAVVDFDVHHGNGTQEIFYERRDVLYISSHQYPFYPGTGALGEIGGGDGAGFTVNLPIPGGKGNGFFTPLYRDVVAPVLRQYRPHLILISAGYDAHFRDPLAGMKVTEDGFAELTAILNQSAAEVCGGRILYVLEGGYDLEALAGSVTATIEATLRRTRYEVSETTRPDPDLPGYLERVRNNLGPYWKV